MKKEKNIVLGVIFIILGAIIGLNTLGITDINLFFRGWWTLFIIIPCLIDLLKNKNKTGDIIGIVIGLFLLLAAQGIINLSLLFKLLLPTILIIVGVSFLGKEYFSKEITSKINKLNKDKQKDYFATFSSEKISIDNEIFEGADLSAVFGGIDIDLSKAKISKDIIINVSAVFGGIKIILPKDVIVKVKSTSIFGGVDNKHENSNIEKIPTIYVNATCVFGGTEIK